jgi:hypothetical protein
MVCRFKFPSNIAVPETSKLPPTKSDDETAFQNILRAFAVMVPLASLTNKSPPVGSVVVEKRGGSTVQFVLVGEQLGLSVAPGE